MATMAMDPFPLFLLLLLLLKMSSFRQTSAVEFIFNRFNSSDLILLGNTTLDSRRIITLTDASPVNVGRFLYRSKIQTRSSSQSQQQQQQQQKQQLLPFYSSFIFSISPFQDKLPGHGFVFLFTPDTIFPGLATASQNLGLFNSTDNGQESNHVFGIEFDVFENPEFNDINGNHVGVDVNSLTSIASHAAGFRSGGGVGNGDDESFNELKLNNGVNYQVWVDFSGSQINVSMARAGKKRPLLPLISVYYDLADVLFDEMYVGFCAATGALVQSHRILAWSFSNSNSSIGEALITSNLPSFVPPKNSVFKSKGFIVGITLGTVFVISCCIGVILFLVKRNQRLKRKREEMEDWELEYWPHRISYHEIYEATKGFKDEYVIGVGGNGKVYKGVMAGGVEIAVKRISHGTNEGMRAFLAEVSSLGRLRHRNLVGLRGWCKREKGSLMLVYDYMENGSLDKKIFDCDHSVVLSWEERLRVLNDVAAGVLYLHEGWESRVLHRDIKASNVLLDKEMNGRLGDFGLARLHGHGQAASTTLVVGTVGYMSPEVIRTGRASAQTDVFGFGILILEVVCGKRPTEEGKTPLVDMVWGLMEQGELVSALDDRLRATGAFDCEEVERVLHLGLLCAYPDPQVRPTMRQVVKLLEGKSVAYESEEGDGMEVSLLDKMKSTTMWSKYRRSLRHGGHPTFEQIRQSISSSTSYSGSDIIVEGR